MTFVSDLEVNMQTRSQDSNVVAQGERVVPIVHGTTDSEVSLSPQPFFKDAFTVRTLPYFFCMLLWITGQTISAAQVIAEQRNYFAAQRAGHLVACEEYSKTEMPHYCKEATADSLAWSTLSDFVSKAVLGFLLCPVIGAAGDIYGRKPFMVVACVANVLVALSLVLYKHRGLPFYWYYVAHAILEAVTAAPTALAALSDCVSPQNRVKCFGLLLACMSFGLILGPVIGKEVGERRTFEVGLMWTLCTVILSLIFLKETVPYLQVNEASRGSGLVQPLLAPPAEVRESRQGIPLTDGTTSNESSSCWRNASAKLPTLAGIKILLRNKLFRTLALCVVINGIVSEGCMIL